MCPGIAPPQVCCGPGYPGTDVAGSAATGLVYTRVYTGKPCYAGVSTGGIVPCVIDHDLPVSLHEQLAGILRTMITDGRITGRVPSILTLAQEYGVSHRTSQRALTTLAGEGLIVAVRGRVSMSSATRAKRSRLAVT